jgi:phosphate transport system permease protein
MTDMALPAAKPIDRATGAAQARLRARYRAEARFKFYGLAAIGLTAVFLVVVLADILIKGLPAFTQHHLRLEVRVDAAQIDPQSTGNLAAIREGDFQALVREAFRAQFPEVRDRPGRRLLDNLLSQGAADDLRDRVVRDPRLIGQTVNVPLILSDDADLYYKSGATRISRIAGRGTATPSGTSGEITVASSTPDFAPSLGAIKQSLVAKARALRLESDRLLQASRRAEARKAELEAALAKARATADATLAATLERQSKAAEDEAQSLGQKAREMIDDAAKLQARYESPGAEETLDASVPSLLVAMNNGLVKVKLIGPSRVTGDVILPLQSSHPAGADSWQLVTYVTPEADRRIGDREVAWLETLRSRGLVQSHFNWRFFTNGDSREAELAGIRGALTGTALTLLVTLIICLPLGVAAAIYLEEFAPKNRATELIEVNINNLAAVPSIVFGLLGLAMFLNFLGLPRSAPLVGGLVLALLVLPTIIIASRAALKAVPPSIKEAALGVGASHQQAIFHHVLPLAMPGIMTGTIIGMAHALGETAPLLMIGMVAFIVEPARSVTDAATVLPVQIYLWSDLPEIAFQAKTAAAIIVLLVFLFVMNGCAIFLRKRFERRW